MVQCPQKKDKCLQAKSAETGLYYLQSRYYNPKIGRFINADALVSTGQGVLGNNMFAYCLNNPVCRIDTSGTDSMEAVDLDGNPMWDENDIQGGGGGNGQYQAPVGGGGVSSSYVVNGTTVDFGHGGRHIDTSNVDITALEKAIAYDVVNRPPSYVNATPVYDFVYGGSPLYYSYYTRDNSRINVGTYYFMEHLR